MQSLLNDHDFMRSLLKMDPRLSKAIECRFVTLTKKTEQNECIPPENETQTELDAKRLRL